MIRHGHRPVRRARAGGIGIARAADRQGEGIDMTQESIPSMDRRSFLKGAFATSAVAAAAGVGTLAGCAAQPKEGTAGASKASAKGTAGTYEFETAPEPIADSDIKETVDADVVIVGAGFSGLCCALSAAENGLNVVMLERMDHVVDAAVPSTP